MPQRRLLSACILTLTAAVAGCLFVGPEHTGWTLSYPEPEGERILQTSSIHTNETIELSGPRVSVIGAFNGRVDANATLRVVLSTQSGLRSTISFVSEGLEPLLAECATGGGDSVSTPHELGMLSIQSSETDCLYELTLIKPIYNAAGNEVTWDIRVPAGPGSSRLQFSAGLR